MERKEITLKAFAKGSTCPPTSKGTLRIYKMRFCPYVERAILVLEAKKIPHEAVNINLVEKPEWYFEKNSEGKVPTLERDQILISDSLIICDYLDEAYTDNPLISEEPLQKAKNHMLVSKFDKVGSACLPFLKYNVDNAVAQWSKILKDLEPFEDELVNRGTKYFNGEKPGMVDYLIWPWFERFEAFEKFYEISDPNFSNQYPKLNAWVADMLLDPTVIKVAHPLETYQKYFQSIKETGVPDFDVGL